jgi:glutamyl/glutaminyl-tRNA synthetase
VTEAADPLDGPGAAPSERPAGLRPARATRFAPAPTGRLHLGHLANALYVWGLARRADAEVILRIEDHDRQRCRPEDEAALLDDLDRLGLAADRPSTDELRAGPSEYRQSDSAAAYAAAFADLRAQGLVYACDCSRTTFEAWRAANGVAWIGAGCPGGCRQRGLDIDGVLAGTGPDGSAGLRAALGGGDEAWTDMFLGERAGPVAPAGDLLFRDRNGNWTYGLCVVVDDLRHGIDLVVRGEDLAESTPTQLRLGQVLGRPAPPAFAHHPLVLRPDGTKLSKAEGATALGAVLDAGQSVEDLVGEAAFRVGLSPAPGRLTLEEALRLVSRPIRD